MQHSRCQHEVHITETNEEDEQVPNPDYLEEFDFTEDIQACMDAFVDEPDKVVSACVTSIEESWFFNFGASSHVIANSTLHSNIEPSQVSYIKTVGGQAMPIEGQGFVTTRDHSGKI